jgi:hypothetical protein
MNEIMQAYLDGYKAAVAHYENAISLGLSEKRAFLILKKSVLDYEFEKVTEGLKEEPKP